jgi:hypothetical protein
VWRRQPLRPVAKASLVALGYVAALAITLLVAGIYLADTSGPDRQGGMSAFGDSLMLLAVFGLAAVPATGAALFFLRPHPAFWLTLSLASLAAASTSGIAAVIHATSSAVEPSSFLQAWSAIAVLRILAAPLFAMLWLLSGLFAPTRSARLSLFAASMLETAAFAYVAFGWFHPPS